MKTKVIQGPYNSPAQCSNLNKGHNSVKMRSKGMDLVLQMKVMMLNKYTKFKKFMPLVVQEKNRNKS